MLETALKLLEKIEESGYRAYIVGGFVRDYLLGTTSTDVDVTTNATPKALKEIFPDATLTNQEYGAVSLWNNSIRFEITTFRKECNYLDHRRPDVIEYVDSLEEDIRRRDFTINTLCMDAKGEIVDLLDGKKDLECRLIRTVGDPVVRFQEDSLRILRAIRFATTLHFTLSKEILRAIRKTRKLLRSLSYQRKREELDKIFTSSNAKEGIRLLRTLGLDKELELSRLKKVTSYDDLMGIWAVLNVMDRYPFNKNEKQLIKEINAARRENNLAPTTLYRYGLYINTVAASIKGISKKEIIEAFQKLPIEKRQDLDITSEEITRALGRKPGPYLKEVYDTLINEVLKGTIPNEKQALLIYCQNHFE